MRVKVRFNAEACQSPIVIDLRFLPRIGERLEIGFRKLIEVQDVRRIDNDNRISGIIRAKYIQLERKAPPPPPPMMTMPFPMRAPGGTPPPAPAPAAVPVAVASETPAEAPAMASYGDLSFDELAAALQQAIPNPA